MAKAIIQQQVDELLKKIGEHDKDLADLLKKFTEYLPLTGGNLTGSIYGNPSGTVNIGSNERFFRELCVKAVRMYNNKGVRVANLYSDSDSNSCVFSPDPDIGSNYNVALGVSARRLTSIETKRISSEDVYASLKNSFILAQGTGNIGYRLPDGGTWTVLGIQGTSTNDIGNHSVFYDSVAGGTTVQGDGSQGKWFLWALRRSI